MECGNGDEGIAQEVGSRTGAFEVPSMRFTILVMSDREVSRGVCERRFGGGR